MMFSWEMESHCALDGITFAGELHFLLKVKRFYVLHLYLVFTSTAALAHFLMFKIFNLG